MNTMDRIALIRAEEKKYHDQCYDRNLLFEPGSWLYKPVRTVMELLPLLVDKEGMRVLDLGAGVGRNAIPIAQYLQSRSASVVAVDLLESAIHGLHDYSRQHGVDDSIEPVLSDIEGYAIAENSFDFIFAVSALEHLRSIDCLTAKLSEMAKGTKSGGIICIIMGTNVREVLEETGETIEPMFELNLPTGKLLQLLETQFRDWDVLNHHVNTQRYSIERQGRAVQLSCDCLTFSVRKRW
ncbi:class I SAM-dependent methyltransferase [Paenibacillus sp. LHD-117]|uniref:class I SAM-dependent methyltransferase n=1 Tax=Paenibacillus sp. LHD-117 TaxID=3071412 RepID=UPI0027E1B5CD|nr:class I SAM-dependent methyltransferase [Paenibacillus sp. LHD-117]MDQ6421753.1 class I SAM-dependent methyltransferase [Paenibacillus sp. LHD-117]